MRKNKDKGEEGVDTTKRSEKDEKRKWEKRPNMRGKRSEEN